MDVTELGEIMVKYGIALRAIPAEVCGVFEKTHIAEYPSWQIVYLKEFKREMLITKRIPKNAGKFIFECNCGTETLVPFTSKEYYDSIEEAVGAFLRLVKSDYHDL